MKSPTVLKALHGNLLLFIKVMKVNVNAQQAVWAFKMFLPTYYSSVRKEMNLTQAFWGKQPVHSEITGLVYRHISVCVDCSPLSFESETLSRLCGRAQLTFKEEQQGKRKALVAFPASVFSFKHTVRAAHTNTVCGCMWVCVCKRSLLTFFFSYFLHFCVTAALLLSLQFQLVSPLPQQSS